MTNNDYFLPGVATLLLAVAFPVFWLWDPTTLGFDYNVEDGRQGYAIGGPAFLALGILSAYVYWAFRRQLHEHYDFRGAHVALALLIGWNLLFAGYVTTVDLLAPVYGDAYRGTTPGQASCGRSGLSAPGDPSVTPHGMQHAVAVAVEIRGISEGLGGIAQHARPSNGWENDRFPSASVEGRLMPARQAVNRPSASRQA